MQPIPHFTTVIPMKKSATPTTLDGFLSSLETQEITVADWARSRGFAVRAVYAVISGHHTGSRGKAREVLKAMGLQPPPMPANRTRAARVAP